jgi:serine phosphatase RsbU (regulator of sigma subunit)
MAKPLIRVLLVEDNPGDAVLIEDMLAERAEVRFELTEVQRLAAARQALAGGSFGVVLLDLSLPDSQGMDTFRALRQAAPGLPMVVLTGLNDEALAVQAVQEGAQDYLVKGQIAGRQLAHALRYAMGRQQRQRGLEETLRTTEAELALARQVHQALLPGTHPVISGADIAGGSLSAGAVGGDLFQYLDLPDGSLGLAVADVTSHGVGPALLMVAVRSYLRAFSQTTPDPGRILTLANRLFCEDVRDGNNCSLFLARLDRPAGVLQYASAGHHPPGFVLGADGSLQARLYSTGTLLGIEPDLEYPVEAVRLRPGDLVLLLTDGVVEARSAARESFGSERPLDLARALRGQEARRIVEAIFQAVGEFTRGRPQADDITAVVVKVLPELHPASGR